MSKKIFCLQISNTSKNFWRLQTSNTSKKFNGPQISNISKKKICRLEISKNFVNFNFQIFPKIFVDFNLYFEKYFKFRRQKQIFPEKCK